MKSLVAPMRTWGQPTQRPFVERAYQKEKIKKQCKETRQQLIAAGYWIREGLHCYIPSCVSRIIYLFLINKSSFTSKNDITIYCNLITAGYTYIAHL